MSSEAASAFIGLLLTYCFRSTVAYLFLWLLARSIRNCHIRFWLYGIFLGGLAATWLWLLLSPNQVPSAAGGTAPGMGSTWHVSWLLSPKSLARLSNGLSRAFWAYGIILAVLLVRFCVRFWQLRTFLRTSQPPSEALSFVFELLRSGTGAPPCELRFVTKLRSPATTGWWRPKVLLPGKLLPRLGVRQLVQVLQHELMHVRRRDYLWDRLSTLGCYLIFFHPVVWLARRCLRWERELVCDEGVVERSRESRLEYATCLTTLANWWFVEEEVTGHVDFLSSAPSLLATRVRGLLTRPTQPYASYTKGAVALLATGALVSVVLLVPKLAVSLYSVSSPDSPRILPWLSSQPTITTVDRERVAKRQKHVASVLPAVAFDSPSAPPNLNFPVNLPILSAPLTDPSSYRLSEASVSQSPDLSSANAEPSEGFQAAGTIWDESPPHPPRRRARKIGHVALRALQLGISVAASRIGDHEHEKPH